MVSVFWLQFALIAVGGIGYFVRRRDREVLWWLRGRFLLVLGASYAVSFIVLVDATVRAVLHHSCMTNEALWRLAECRPFAVEMAVAIALTSVIACCIGAIGVFRLRRRRGRSDD